MQMRSSRLMVFSFLAAAAVAAAGCGSGTTANDMGMDLGGIHDLSIPPGDMVMVQNVLTGTQLTPGRFAIIDVTTDDDIVYADSTGNISSVPIAGGASVSIGTSDAQPFVRGKVVFFNNNTDQTSLVSDLSIWTKANGAQQLATATSLTWANFQYAHTYPPIFAASDDGQYVMFLDNASSDGFLADLVVGKTDGSSRTTIVTQATTGYDGGPCVPRFTWAQAAGRFTAVYCTAAGDAAAGTKNVIVIDPTAPVAAPAPLSTNVNFISVRGGGALAIVESGGALDSAPLPFLTGTSVITSVDTGVGDAEMIPGGTGVAYIDNNGGLHRATTPGTPTLTSLAGAGAAIAFVTLSPDGKYAMTYANVDSQGQLTDLLVNSTETPGAPVSLIGTTTAAGGFAYGDAFTADSTYALGFDQVDQDGTGTLMAVAVGGGTPTTYTTRVWVVLSGTGHKILFNDNYNVVMNHQLSDLKVGDAAASGQGTLIATNAEVDFFMSTDRSKVVFSVQRETDTAKNGVYAATVP
jgi:hypothetical protein